MRLDKLICLWVLLLAAASAGPLALPGLAQAPAVAVEIPAGLPLQVLSSEFSDSDFERRGGAMVINLAGSVRFRHDGSDPIRAITLRIDAREQALGGRAAVVVPSLHASRGDQFEVNVNLRLLRPLPLPPGPVVRIEPDAVLFASLAAAGPDRLDSIRKMRVLEMEARRDREFFLTRWSAGGKSALTSAMQASLRRQAARPRLEVRLAGNGPATTTAGIPSRELEIAFVANPEAPLVLEGGTALIRGVIADAPRFRLRNRARQGVRHFEIAWLVRDARGTVYSVGSAPVDQLDRVGPQERFETRADGRFRIHPVAAGRPPAIEAVSAYLRSAQLDDGSVWVPSRQALQASNLIEAVPVSAEEQRLSQLYRERGAEAVAAELRRLAGADTGASAR